MPPKLVENGDSLEAVLDKMSSGISLVLYIAADYLWLSFNRPICYFLLQNNSVGIARISIYDLKCW